MLTEEQLRFVKANDRRQKLIADPGSGKTFTIKYKAKSYGRDVLALTFTIRMSMELKALPNIAYAGTTLSWFYSLLTDKYQYFGYKNVPVVISSGFDAGIVGRIKMELSLKKFDIENIIKRLIDDETITYYESNAFDIYRNILCRRNIVSYPLIEYYAYILSSKFNNLTNLKRCIIDEFQDTTGNELKILENIGFQNISVVGDPAQTLYEWRGADPEFITKLDYNEYMLTRTFRVPDKVCELANDVLEKHRIYLKEIKMQSKIKGEIIRINRNDIIGFMKQLKIYEYQKCFFLVPYNKSIDYYSKLLMSNGIKVNIIGGKYDYKDTAFKIAMLLKKNKDFLYNYQKSLERNIIDELLKADIDTMIDVLARNELEKNSLKRMFSIYKQYMGNNYSQLEEYIDEYKPGVYYGIINLMTIHQSKGLEADIVIVDDKFVKNNDEGIRMKYVAYTRTKNTLIIVE